MEDGKINVTQAVITRYGATDNAHWLIGQWLFQIEHRNVADSTAIIKDQQALKSFDGFQQRWFIAVGVITAVRRFLKSHR